MPSPRPWKRYDTPTYDQTVTAVAEQADEIAATLHELAEHVSPADLAAKACLLQAAEECARARALLLKGQAQ